MNYIDCVALILVENRKLLLGFSKNKNAWYLPGGKMDPGETNLGALQRELKEELNIDLTEDSVQWYYYIEAPAFGENNLLMKQECFLSLHPQHPQPSAEIEAIRYFDLATYQQEEHLVPGVLMAFEKLQQDGLVD